MPEAEKTEQVLSPEFLLRKHGRRFTWWQVLLIAALPTTVPAVLSYRASVKEAQMHNAETKDKAEAGYDALVKAVELLEKNDLERAKSIAELNGHIMALESLTRHVSPHYDKSTKETHLDIKSAGWKPSFPAPITPPSPTDVAAQLPKSLDAAAKK